MKNTILKLSDYKMNCSDIENLANDFIDQELAEITDFSIKRHVSECPECLTILNEFSQITQWASELGDIPLPNNVSLRLRQKLGLR